MPSLSLLLLGTFRATLGGQAITAFESNKVRALLPGAIELVYNNYNALAIGFGPTERASDVIFSIAVRFETRLPFKSSDVRFVNPAIGVRSDTWFPSRYSDHNRVSPPSGVRSVIRLPDR